MSGAPTNEDFPSLYVAADKTSIDGQRRFLKATGVRLVAAVVAAGAAVELDRVSTGPIRPLGLVVAGAFVLALALEVWLLNERPERDWFDGRAVAESAKTLVWRYAVGGVPFRKEDEDSTLRLGEELAGLPEDTPDTLIIPTSHVVVTQWMKELRASPLEDRRSTYIDCRIVDQQQWYRSKAEYNDRRARRWRLVLIALEFAGVVFALVEAFGFLRIDLAGVTSAMIGSGAAWLGVKQHESMARAYTLASIELSMVAARLAELTDEESWSREVADAEEAISREHTMWRAARIATGGSSLKSRRHH